MWRVSYFDRVDLVVYHEVYFATLAEVWSELRSRAAWAKEHGMIHSIKRC